MIRCREWLLAILVGTAGVCVTCRAEVISIVNPGFEAETAPVGSFRVTDLTGWMAYDPNNLIDANGADDVIGVIHADPSTDFFPAGAPEGDNAALIFIRADIGLGQVGITQQLTDTLQPNTRYTLEVEVGNIASGTTPGNPGVFFNLDGFPGYTVQLLAVEDDQNMTMVVIDEDFNLLFGSIDEGTFETSVVQVDIGDTHDLLGRPLAIRLINLNVADTPDPGIEVDFDDVRLTATVLPEPASLMLLLLGGLSIAARPTRLRN